MSDNESSAELSEELKSVEMALGALSPAVGRFDRDRLMYLAGQASVDGRNHADGWPSATGVASYRRFAWPMATAASLLVAAMLGGMAIAERGHERVVYFERPITGGATATVSFPTLPSGQLQAKSPDQSNYLQLRRFGAHAWD